MFEVPAKQHETVHVESIVWKQPYRADLTICKRCHTIGDEKFDDARWHAINLVPPGRQHLLLAIIID
jgi:hypothetical protein